MFIKLENGFKFQEEFFNLEDKMKNYASTKNNDTSLVRGR